MLLSLHIENIAVIEKADIEFDSGLNVLTGETGAGKSIIIDAINAVLGERVSRDLIRTGSDKAEATALFCGLSESALQVMEDCGLAADEDGNVLIQRSIAVDGKNGCRLNGKPLTVSLLRTIGRTLVNIHGQHENQALLNPDRHLVYLDKLGNITHEKEQYQQAYHAYCALRKQLKALQTDEGEKARRVDLLTYEIGEIDKAELQPGEYEKLSARRNFCRNAERVADGLNRAKSLMDGDTETEGALSAVTDMASQIGDTARFMTEAEPLSKQLESVRYDLQECAQELRELVEALDFDPAELEQVESRLEVLHRILVKYGENEEAVLAYREKAQAELDRFESAETVAAELEEKLQKAEDETIQRAEALTKARRKAADVFVHDVTEQLTYLDMPYVRLEVSMEPTTLTLTGGDKVEFLIAANPGEPAKSIARIASGGELSRIMLAIQTVLADADGIDTLVFDEVDTGISGRAAQKVGVKLREAAAARQILCVTHLAQIAAQAHHHLLIAKHVENGRTFTQVTPLSAEQREAELARIIGGEVTDANLHAAREMLQRGEK